MDKKIYFETDLVAKLSKFLEVDGYSTLREVPNMGQSVDIVGVKDKCITLMEAKMDNWRRALQQCKAHELVADYICIGLARKTSPPKLDEIANETGLGIVLCDKESGICEWHIRPKRNRQIWEPQRKRLENNLKENNNGS
jgi:hypothetical protein